MTVTTNQDGSAIPADCELFVYSQAVPEDAPERVKAKERGIRQLAYFEALGELSAGQEILAVCGTHGKSSSTAMLGHVLTSLGHNPTVVLGANAPNLGGTNGRSGREDLWVIEACEYRRQFLSLQPKAVILTTVDGDHFDAFSSIEDYRSVFTQFFGLLPKDGVIVFHGADAAAKALAEKSGRRCIDADQYALPELRVPGQHMRRNAQLVLALCIDRGIEKDKVLEALKQYVGIERRMEVLGSYGDDVLCIDDYAHHPLEIEATLHALKEFYPARRLVAVFQPHTFDRTRKLYEQFTKAFTSADLILLTDTYEARRESAEPIDHPAFAQAIEKESGVTCTYTGNLEATKSAYTSQWVKTGDLLVTLGAGTVTKLGRDLVR